MQFEERHKKGDILNLFFEEFVEEHLLQPTFIMDHPIEISPLTKKKPENPEYVERFEFFMNGWEMANAYSELNDPIDQRERFKEQDALADAGDEEANTHRRGLPERTGDRYAADRWYRIRYRPYVYAADRSQQAIRDVLLFPTMKTLGGCKSPKTVKGSKNVC
ncbi:MAG: amino acid--tRNA ligase-related protein [Lachnospiraceae bacterium]